MFLNVAYVAEAILKKNRLESFNVHGVLFFFLSLILSSRRVNCTNLYQFWHRNISNIGAPEET